MLSALSLHRAAAAVSMHSAAAAVVCLDQPTMVSLPEPPRFSEYSSPLLLQPFAFRPSQWMVDVSSSASSQRTESHSNPHLLDGFLLDADSTSDAAVSSRKRKDAESTAADAPLRKRPRGKSLFVSTRRAPAPDAGDVSPVLALMQSSSSWCEPVSSPVSAPSDAAAVSAPPKLSKKERAAARERKQVLKLQRLEASIAALQAQLSVTQAAEEAATQRAHGLALQAQEAARLVAADPSQMVDAFFAVDTSDSMSTLPPLSPLDLSATNSSISSVRDSPQTHAGHGGLASGASSDAESANSTPLVCCTATPASVGLDEEIASLRDGTTMSTVAELHLREKLRQLRAVQSVIDHMDVPVQEGPTVACAASFIGQFGASVEQQYLLSQLALSTEDEDAATERELEASIAAFTAAIVAQSRAHGEIVQQGVNIA